MLLRSAERERALQHALSKLSKKTAELNALRKEWADFQTKVQTREKLLSQKERACSARSLVKLSTSALADYTANEMQRERVSREEMEQRYKEMDEFCEVRSRSIRLFADPRGLLFSCRI